MHNITIKNNKIIEIIIVLFVQLILSILECNFLKTGYISFCRLCFLMKGMQSRCLSIYVKIDAYFNRKGSFSKSKPVYLKIQMQANVTLQMYFKKAHPLMLISLLNCSAAVKS